MEVNKTLKQLRFYQRVPGDITYEDVYLAIEVDDIENVRKAVNLQGNIENSQLNLSKFKLNKSPESVLINDGFHF